MADPRDFLLNTDYEMDKIILYKTGEAPENENISIPHNLSFTPLMFGICSRTPDFAETYSIPMEAITSDGQLDFDLWADDENIYIWYIGTSPKIYYRIYAFEPSNSRAHTPHTSNNAHQFILNTDYNYCKLKEKGVVDTTNGPVTIDHNLNYIPQVLVWTDDGALVNTNARSQYVTVTDQSITISTNGIAHYRIYYDEA